MWWIDEMRRLSVICQTDCDLSLEASIRLLAMDTACVDNDFKQSRAGQYHAEGRGLDSVGRINTHTET